MWSLFIRITLASTKGICEPLEISHLAHCRPIFLTLLGIVVGGRDMAGDSEGTARSRLRPRWLDRRRLYTGGAMMILAPLGLTGCPADDDKDKVDVPVDVVADRPDMPDGWVDPEVIAIAPPFDPGQIDYVWPEAIAVAPYDQGPMDAPPDVIAIAPFDVGPTDAPPEMIAIAPFDPGSDAPPVQPKGGFKAACVVDGDCIQEYVCANEAICIAPVPGCGIPACMPLACGANDACPEGSVCFPYDNKRSGSTMKTCIRQPAQVPDGFADKCAPIADTCSSPQNFCRDACPPDIFCIAATDACLPIVCEPDGAPCPSGSTCEDVGIASACVKTP
jgi:hypothetical protein